MSSSELAPHIEAAWERRDRLSPQSKGADVEAIEAALDLLDNGEARVATRASDGRWETHQWLKKAVLLSFRIGANHLIGAVSGDPSPGPYWDKAPSKFLGWSETSFEKAGFRAVPGAIVRRGSFIAKNVVLMPSFVNIGAFVDEATMIDTWATVGSCAQIGKNVHISGGAGIGGVLEPLQASPTIIEDNCFIGARSEVAEGVIVREGAVLAMGTFISQSTKIVDRETGETFRGEVPPYAVVVPGAIPGAYQGAPSLACAVIVKRVDAQTRAKTSINELLRT
jgi:2,3,4,5-tetrahydropyridine-2-carboxylate N-succinyltransferase